MRSGSVAVFMALLAVCVVALAGVARADGADWVTVASTADAAVAAVAPAVEELAPVVAMEVSATATAKAPAAVDVSSLSLMEVGASTELLDFASLGEEGTLGLDAEAQEAIVAEALDELEIEFIRDYGTDEDRAQLERFMAEDKAADEALAHGDHMRFAHTEAGAAALRRRGGGRGGGGGAGRIAAKSARMGFASGNTSPQGLAQQAGPQNSRKMGGGFFKRLGRGIKKFAKKAGRWLRDRFFGGRRRKHRRGGRGGFPSEGDQPMPPQQQPPQPQAQPGAQPPAPGPQKGWFGRMFDKVKAVGAKVGGAMSNWGNKVAGWGKGLAQFGAKAFGNTKLGKFFGNLGGGVKRGGNKLAQWGNNIQSWLNGKPVPPGTKGAVVLPKNAPAPAPGTPGGANGPKIVPGMPGTYKDAKGKWRGPDGRRVYTAKQQLKRDIRKAERKAARDARRAARERRRAERQARMDAHDKAELEKHLEWRRRKLEEQADRAAANRRNRKDYSGVDPDFPGAGWRLHTPEEIEDCVTCRYVWLQVEQDIGNTQMEDNVYDAFNQNALEAMKQPIFYPAVQIMYDAVDDMIGDYMDGLNVNQICENSLLCRMPEN